MLSSCTYCFSSPSVGYEQPANDASPCSPITYRFRSDGDVRQFQYYLSDPSGENGYGYWWDYVSLIHRVERFVRVRCHSSGR